MNPPLQPEHGRHAWVDAVWATSDLKPLEKLVALAYAKYAGEGTERVWVTFDRLVSHTCLSRDAASRALRGLREKGWLVMVEAARQQRAARYQLVEPVSRTGDVPLSRTGDEPLSRTGDAPQESQPYASRHPAVREAYENLTNPTITPPKGGGPLKRGTRIPDDFIATAEMRQWAADRTPLVDVDHSTERFVNHWRAKAGKDATKLDWLATWRNWLIRDQDDRSNRKLTPTERARQTAAAGRRLAARTVAGQVITTFEIEGQPQAGAAGIEGHVPTRPGQTCRRHDHWEHDEPCHACRRDRVASEAQHRPLTRTERNMAVLDRLPTDDNHPKGITV